MRNILIVIMMLLINLQPISAQSEDCSSRETALLTAMQSCSMQEANTICLGHASVESVVNCEDIPDFTTPGDTIPLAAICMLRLNALQSDGQWGIAFMQVPTSQAVDLTMVLLGDLEIHNTGGGASQLRVWTKQDTLIHSGPGRPYEVLRTAPAGTVLLVNACNCTRHWFRTVLQDGRAGWLSALDVSILGEETGLPIAEMDTPVYEPMQAFNFTSGQHPASCAEATAGILIQAPAGSTAVPLQINGVEVVLNSTIFIQSQPEHALKIMVLDGVAQVTADRFSVNAPSGTLVFVPLSADNLLIEGTTVQPLSEEDIIQLPLDLLPVAVNPTTAMKNPSPQIVGLEPCEVVSGQANALCPLHFINLDGDGLTRMEVIFLQAPQGDWVGSVIEPPEIVTGTQSSGQIAWEPSCSLGAANFIGPIKWNIILTDEQGHTSAPFEASFNCVEG